MREPSEKSYVVAVCLAGIFGVVGVHHFYLGRYVEGTIDFGMFVATLYLFITGHFWWGVLVGAIDALHTIIVTIMLLVGAVKDGQGKVVCYPGQRLA